MQTKLLRMAGLAAKSKRSTRGCGSFGGCKPSLCCLTIEETSARQESVSKVSDKRRKETHEGRKGDDA